MADGEWYWCLDHDRVEPADSDCPPDKRHGPYPTKEAAADWQANVDARNDKWDAEDAAWEGDDET
jgi:hypothetical protein